jgi:hypothetical protein
MAMSLVGGDAEEAASDVCHSGTAGVAFSSTFQRCMECYVTLLGTSPIGWIF